MNTHPYLRAYMAGVTFPTLFFLLAFLVFCALRLNLNPEFPVERILVFPLALVPPIWGGWNMLYLALAGRPRLPVGLHGALIPLLLIPVALAVSPSFGFAPPPEGRPLLLIIVPPLMFIYYLLWKYLVAFLNRLLGIA